MTEANDKKEKQILGLRLRAFFAKLKPTWFDKHDAVALLGICSIVRGIAMYSHPLAYIGAGTFALVLSYMSAQPEITTENKQ